MFHQNVDTHFQNPLVICKFGINFADYWTYFEYQKFDETEVNHCFIKTLTLMYIFLKKKPHNAIHISQKNSLAWWLLPHACHTHIIIHTYMKKLKTMWSLFIWWRGSYPCFKICATNRTTTNAFALIVFV